MLRGGLDTAILRKMGEPIGETPALGPWRTFLDRRNKATKVVNIGLVNSIFINWKICYSEAFFFKEIEWLFN